MAQGDFWPFFQPHPIFHLFIIPLLVEVVLTA